MNKPRLIDANEALNIIRNGWSNHYSCKDMCDEINNIPTAYDINEVVKQLEECSVTYCKEYGYAEDENVLYLPDAIEIVKGGAE